MEFLYGGKMNVKNRLEIYKCSVCGNVVEVIFAGGGELVCCGKPMILQIENTADGYKVKVGSVPHPMEEKHFITMIELTVDGNVCTKILKPGEAPEAIFCVKGSVASAREYCSLHGLWKV